MASRIRVETNVQRQPLKANGKVKSKAVVEALDGCKASKIERPTLHMKSNPQKESNALKRCGIDITKRTALGNISNINKKTTNTNGVVKCDEKNNSKTRLRKKLEASKAIIGLKGKKGQNMPCKTTIDQPESLINVDSKKTNGNTSEVPMEEDDLCAQTSKAIIGLKGKKGQNLGCKTKIDQPESLINVYAKKTNGDTSDVPMEEDEPCTQTPFSLPNGVENIDAESSDDPQLCAENAQTIIAYMKQLESIQDIKPKFLSGSLLSGKMRAVLINWLAEVHLQFKLMQETLYLTVALVDRYLSMDGHSVKRQKVQLVGVSAMLIACKYEEMYIPQVDDFVYITDEAYTVQEILSMELHMLQVLKFQLGRPLSIHFLRRNSKAGYVEQTHHVLAKYILEACMVEYDLAHVAPSKMAAAALLLSLKLQKPQGQFQAIWNPNLVYYSGYKVEELQNTIQKMAAIMKGIHTSKFNAAYNKYNSPSNQKIASLVTSNAQIIEILNSLTQGTVKVGNH